MGFSLILTGIVFLFLPNIDIIDLLPDFIGIIFIISGLKKLSDLNPHISEAKEKFKNSLYVAVAKFILMFFVPYFNNHDEGWILIFTFTFAVLEMVFLVPAFKSMLDGFVCLGDRTATNAVFENQKEYSLLTTVFLAVRAALALIPELSFISTPEYSGNVTQAGGFYLSNYKTILMFLNIVVTTVLGIIWLVFSVKYFKGIYKDKNLLLFLEEEYKTKVLSKKGLFIFRRIKFALWVGFFALVFGLDWIVDYVNIIPDVISAGLFLWSAILLKKYINSKFMIISSSLYILLSGIDCFYSTLYAIKFPAVNLWTNYKAYEMFVKVNIIHSISSLCSVFCIVSFFLILNKIILNHTGSCVFENQSSEIKRGEEFYRLKKNNIKFLSFAIISALLGIARMILLYALPLFYLADLFVFIIFIIITLKFINSLLSSVEYKYL